MTLPSTPEVATLCNCSLCRRIGGPWVYFGFGTVKIEGHPDVTAQYIQGDRTLRTIFCRLCGCVTHWEPMDPKPGAKHGVNLGNFDPALIAAVRVRKFDGANTWKFFDELEPGPGKPRAMPGRRRSQEENMPQFLYRVRPTRPGMLTEGPSEREAQVLAEHFAYLSELTDQGTVLMAGRTLTADEHTFGIAVLVAATQSDAEALMNNDPAVRHGVMRAELFPYHVALWSRQGPPEEAE